jgi:hypothetical protein
MFIGEIGGVNIAATLACCYALALIAAIVTVLMAVISRQGTMGHLTRYSRRGPIVLSFLLLLGAADLVLGAIMVRRGRRGFVLMVPLAFIFVAGSIGEVVDIIAGSCVTSNLIGGGILLLGVIPLLLLSRELVPAT